MLEIPDRKKALARLCIFSIWIIKLHICGFRIIFCYGCNPVAMTLARPYLRFYLVQLNGYELSCKAVWIQSRDMKLFFVDYCRQSDNTNYVVKN